LATALRDGDAAVRAESARALAALGPALARPASAPVAPELFVLLDDGPQDVRWAAADALSAPAVDGAQHLPALERALPHPGAYTRGVAAWTVNQAGPGASGAVAALEARLHDPDPGVRTLAIRALGNLDRADPAAVAGLAEAVLHETGDARWR